MKHNIDTFNDAIVHLRQYGKVAVVQPTGTGKSFIAMQIMKTMPNSKKLMLAPSKDFLDALSSHDYFDSDNTITLTYQFLAKNKNNIVEKISELVDIDDVELIILDELHRAGSPVWQETVLKIIAGCENAKLLGLTATPIRSVDKRDMVEELFDGYSVGNISLNTAISSKILPKLNYVVSMFDANMELNKFIHQNRRHSFILNRMGAEYKELKDKWNIDNTFKHTLSKHLTPDGVKEGMESRHIVFVTKIEDMEKTSPKVKQWFEAVYPGYKVNVYNIHSGLSKYNNTNSIKAFSAPLNKNEINVIVAVQMLTESFHFDKLKSITMLRRTESANVYIQQIGRALSASSSEMPYIFDFVDNFGSIGKIAYMIGSVQKNQSTSEVGVIFNTFIDEASECKSDIEAFQNKLDSRVVFYTHGLFRYAEEYGTLHDIPNEKMRDWSIQQYRYLRANKPEYIERHLAEFELTEFIEGKASSSWYKTLKEFSTSDSKVKADFISKTLSLEICTGIPQNVKDFIDNTVKIDYSCTNDIEYLKKPVLESNSKECKIVKNFIEALEEKNTFKTWYYFQRCTEAFSKESQQLYGESNYDKACAHRLFDILVDMEENSYVKEIKLNEEENILFTVLYKYRYRSLIGIDKEDFDIICDKLLNRTIEEYTPVTIEIMRFFKVITREKLIDVIDDMMQLTAQADRIKQLSSDILLGYNPYGSTPEALREALGKFYSAFNKEKLNPELVERINIFEASTFPYIALALNDESFYNLEKAKVIVEYNKNSYKESVRMADAISKCRGDIHSINKLIRNTVGEAPETSAIVSKYIDIIVEDVNAEYEHSSKYGVNITPEKQKRFASIYTMYKLYNIGIDKYSKVDEVISDKEFMERLDRVMLTVRLRRTIDETVSYMIDKNMEFKLAAFEANLYRGQSQRDEQVIELILLSDVDKADSMFYTVVSRMNELAEHKYNGPSDKLHERVVHA